MKLWKILHFLIFMGKTAPKENSFLIRSLNLNRPNPGKREKINLNFYFRFLRCLKRFYEGLKGDFPMFSGGIEVNIN